MVVYNDSSSILCRAKPNRSEAYAEQLGGGRFYALIAEGETRKTVVADCYRGIIEILDRVLRQVKPDQLRK
jgi:hypothetical protein